MTAITKDSACASLRLNRPNRQNVDRAPFAACKSGVWCGGGRGSVADHIFTPVYSPRIIYRHDGVRTRLYLRRWHGQPGRGPLYHRQGAICSTLRSGVEARRSLYGRYIRRRARLHCGCAGVATRAGPFCGPHLGATALGTLSVSPLAAIQPSVPFAPKRRPSLRSRWQALFFVSGRRPAI